MQTHGKRKYIVRFGIIYFFEKIIEIALIRQIYEGNLGRRYSKNALIRRSGHQYGLHSFKTCAFTNFHTMIAIEKKCNRQREKVWVFKTLRPHRMTYRVKVDFDKINFRNSLHKFNHFPDRC